MALLSPETIAVLGLILGVVARMALPYLRKLWSGEIKEFQIYYIWQSIAGLILALVAAVLIAPNILIIPEATFLQSITTNFLVGFGSEALINEIFALRDLRTKNNVTPVTPT